MRGPVNEAISPSILEKTPVNADHTTPASNPTQELRAFLSEYYGRVLQGTGDLEKNACCVASSISQYSEIAELIPDEVKDRNYGCGCCIPADELKGLNILDLGSGTGLDCFILSHLAGEKGRIYGIDMTDEQLEIARRNIPVVMSAYGYSESNVFFNKDFIETLESIEDSTIDLVVSDCAINLSPAKDSVFNSIYRVLKTGGEFYISDIVADRRLPDSIRDDRKLHAECLGGALYEYDLLDTVTAAGFRDPRCVSRSLVEENIGGQPNRFYSMTLRGFKFETPLDPRCEDFAQSATYLGNCPGSEDRFLLDRNHLFEKDSARSVCRNTARMLSETRLSKYFEVTGELEHRGIFDCSTPTPATDESPGCC